MTLQEIIDLECQRVIEEICAARYLRKADVLGKRRAPHLKYARRDIIRTLFRNGFRKADIARNMRRNHSAIKYWIDPENRKLRREQMQEYMSRRKAIFEVHA